MKPSLALLRRELASSLLFDEGIEAARNACVAGASIAAAAMVAAAYSDSPVVGIPALRLCMGSLQSTALDVAAWCIAFRQRDGSETPDFAFAPGFGLVTEQQAKLLL